MKNIVLALGGNALGNTPKEQAEAVKTTSKSIVDLIEQGNKVVVVHGNGPQVGMIYNSFDESSKTNEKIPKLSLALSGAMSQGYIGLHLQQAIQNELSKRSITKNVSSLVTQTKVDINDPAFKDPTKPIGSFMSQEVAAHLSIETGVTVGEDAGRGWRVMVPSPKPVSIYQKDMILQLANNGHVVIAGGGGGIPTIEENGILKEVDAVIDKDFTAAKIAQLIDADVFMIVTDTDGIWKGYGTEEGYQLIDPSIDELVSLVESGEFPAGSMRPKVEAIIDFVKNNDKKVESCITSLSKTADALEGKAGTWLRN